MAKFCTKCGTELKNGKCSKCDVTKKETVKKEEVKKVEPTQTESTIDIKGGFNECVEVLKNFFKKPIETIKDFLSESKNVAGMIMILLASIAKGLYKIALLNSVSGKLSKPDADFLSTELESIRELSYDKIKEPDYFGEFFKEFFTSLGLFALIVIAGWFIVVKVFKKETNIKLVINMTAISLVTVICANVINSGLIYIDEEVIGYIRTYIFTFADIIKYLVFFVAIKEVSKIDDNKLFVSVASVFVLATAALDIILKVID